MDEVVDRLARKVAEATSRRGFLGWVGKGAAVALGLASAGALGAGGAAAQQQSQVGKCCTYFDCENGAPLIPIPPSHAA